MRPLPIRSSLVLTALALAVAPAGAQGIWGSTETDLHVQASSPDPWDEFGFSLGLDGDLAAVGAQGDDDAGADAGAVYVLGRNVGGPGAWGEALKLTATDAAPGDRLGRQVGLGGNLVVANSMKLVAGSYPGAVYLFDATTGAQVQRLNDASSGSDSFGKAVATDGVNVVVGMGWDGPGPGFFDGRAAVYDALGNFRFYLNGLDVDEGDYFGEVVAVDGPYIAVGAEAKENGGAVYVFDAVTGAQLHKLVGSGVASGEIFGREIDIDGDKLIAAGSGEVWVFDLITGAELWNLYGEASSIPFFASQVAIAGDWAYIGSSALVFPGNYMGRVMQVCLTTGLTVVEFHNVPPVLGILARDALVADGTTILSGDGASGALGFNNEGVVNVMTTAGLGLIIDKDQVAIPDVVTLTMRGGAPTLPGALALTAVNGVPLAPAIFFTGTFDVQGQLATPPLPVGPILVGLTLEIMGGGIAKDLSLAFSNPVELTVF